MKPDNKRGGLEDVGDAQSSPCAPKDSSSSALPARQLVDQWRMRAIVAGQFSVDGPTAEEVEAATEARVLTYCANALEIRLDALAALLDPARQLTEKKEDHTRVAPPVDCVAPVGSTAEQGQGEQSPPVPDVDVQLLAWAVSNCHTMARRRLRALKQRIPLDALLEKELESWEHGLRICEKAGARSAGVLRASVPTEMTEGSQMIPPSLALRLLPELRAYLDSLTITGDTIGDIRRQCFMPWDSEWNGIVRDETAQRECASRLDPAPPQEDLPAEAAKILRDHAWDLYDGTPLDPAPPETNEEELTRRDSTGEPVVSSPPHPPTR